MQIYVKMLIFAPVKQRKALYFALLLLAQFSCSTTQSLQDGEYLLRKNTVRIDSKALSSGELASYIAQKPNTYLFGLNPFLSIYNWDRSDGSFWKKIGDAPVVYDPTLVDKSISSIENHLRYIGYYGSVVESRVQVKGRKVRVTYYVALGRRYKISAIDYDLPDDSVFREEFRADLPNSSLSVGDYLSEADLEAEAERSARYFRNIGYYGFSQRFYAFEADTLSADGNARLTLSIRDDGTGDASSAAETHRKYRLNRVTIEHPERLKIRSSVLEDLNTLRPGQLYREKDINTAYARLASVNMLSGVNIDMTPVADDLVDCNISLRSSGLQGFKTNLEASVNSSGLMGLSPQLSYYHKNLFHGGEVLNIGVRGNFQFKFYDPAYSTEISATSTLRFPRFLGMPNRFFQGPNIPRTDLSLAFSYQDRPEYRRTVISSAFTYNGRLGERLFYQFTPIRANIVRVFNLSEDFIDNIVQSIYMMQAYNNNFDIGVSGMLYYTTDASAIPSRPYHYFRLGVDISGNVVSLFNALMPSDEDGQHTIWNTPYAQYVRGEFQAGKVFRFGKEDRHALALRFWGGAGYAYGNSLAMPLERYFYSGGAMSMRGWQSRALGPGTDRTYAEIFAIPSQIGDMKLEANAEYRFPLFGKVEGALFVDAGNIWSLPGHYEQGAGAIFSLRTLPESFAMDWGTGLRLNLNFILLRLDLGIRLHDPGRDAGDRWLLPRQWVKSENMAVHFGVGYPF